MRLFSRAQIVTVVFTALIMTCTAARANDVYVGQSAAGSGDGSSCSNSYAASFFNTSGNWGSGKPIQAGTTVHLCGTITSELSARGSGSSGSPITIKFETGASLQISPGCDSNGCFSLGSYNYLVVDGGTPCGWNTATNSSEGTCNGFIRSMLVGSPGATCAGGPCTTTTGGNLLRGMGSNLEVKNIGLYNSYVHTASSNDGGGANSQCVFLSDGSNLSVHDSTMHDASWCLVISFSTPQSNWSIYNNQIYNVCHGMAIGDGSSSASASNANIHGNYVHDFKNWDTASDAWHHNAIHLYGQDGGSGVLSNINMYDNLFGGDVGGNTTAQVYVEGSLITSGMQIFNNVFTATNGSYANNGLLVVMTGKDNSGVYNNTMVGTTTSGGMCLDIVGMTGVTGFSVKNNIISTCNVLVASWPIAGTGYLASGGLNNNTYAGCSNSNGASCFYGPSGFENSFSDWKTDMGGQDINSQLVTSAGLGSDFRLQSGSPAIGFGTNLTSLGISALDSDLTGTSRPASGAWDDGIYNFLSTGAPAPPSQLIAIPQ